MPVDFDVELIPVSPGPVPSLISVTPQPAPLLSLDAFRQILKYPPYQFWGLDNEDVGLDSQCNGVVYEYAFQNTGVGGRDDIRQALILAQQKLRDFLGYPIAPQYIEETLPYPTYLDKRLIRSFPSQPGGGWVSVELPDHYVQAIGIESLEYLDEVAVAYEDRYGTGVNDTFTFTIATTETDPDKIAVYFSSTDRIDNQAVGPRWRIEPIQVSIEGGVATITGRSWILVKPELYEGYNRKTPLNPATASNFVETLEVYIRETNPDGTTVTTSQGTFHWDDWPAGFWWGFCCQNSTDPAATASAIARVGIKNAELGIVIPGEAVYNETDQEWQQTIPPWSSICRPPQRVTIRYLAGQSLDSAGNMNSRLAHAVAYLAMADLPERICACDNANRTLYRYQQVMNQTGAGQNSFAVTREMLNNPFGNKYGHWMAWNEVKTLRLPRGAS